MFLFTKPYNYLKTVGIIQTTNKLIKTDSAFKESPFYFIVL